MLGSVVGCRVALPTGCRLLILDIPDTQMESEVKGLQSLVDSLERGVKSVQAAQVRPAFPSHISPALAMHSFATKPGSEVLNLHISTSALRAAAAAAAAVVLHEAAWDPCSPLGRPTCLRLMSVLNLTRSTAAGLERQVRARRGGAGGGQAGRDGGGPA